LRRPCSARRKQQVLAEAKRGRWENPQNGPLIQYQKYFPKGIDGMIPRTQKQARNSGNSLIKKGGQLSHADTERPQFTQNRSLVATMNIALST
jgi:hypothetical protein